MLVLQRGGSVEGTCGDEKRWLVDYANDLGKKIRQFPKLCISAQLICLISPKCARCRWCCAGPACVVLLQRGGSVEGTCGDEKRWLVDYEKRFGGKNQTKLYDLTPTEQMSPENFKMKKLALRYFVKYQMRRVQTG